jgi:hypothetical protein
MTATVRKALNLWPKVPTFTRDVCKVRELTLLFRVGTLWRGGDGLFFEVPSLASDALITTLHPLLENVLQTVNHFEISCLGAPFSWLEKTRNRMGRGLDCMADVLMGFHRSRWAHPLQLLNRVTLTLHYGCSAILKRVLFNHRNSVSETWVKRCKKCIACQGRYFEKEMSPHLHKVLTRSNKVNPRTLPTALVFSRVSVPPALTLNHQLCGISM